MGHSPSDLPSGYATDNIKLLMNIQFNLDFVKLGRPGTGGLVGANLSLSHY